MAQALIRGLLRAGTHRSQIRATVKREEQKRQIESAHQIEVTYDNVAAVKAADVVVLAVKPQALHTLLRTIAPALSDRQLIISIAAGVPIEGIDRLVELGRLQHDEVTGPHHLHIVRAMPNTPCLVGKGATAIALGEHATPADLRLAETLFESVGITTNVDESLIDAVTGLSGSGPAYIFLVIEALSDAGVKVGLSRHVALKLAAQTVLGSAHLLLETGQHPGHLKDQVTSPGGTAIAGLHTLEAGGLRTTLINAVEAATLRARQLGQLFLEKIAASRN